MKQIEPTVIATDGKHIEVGMLSSLPKKLMSFDDLDKVEYKVRKGKVISETELQELFDKFNVPCILI